MEKETDLGDKYGKIEAGKIFEPKQEKQVKVGKIVVERGGVQVGMVNVGATRTTISLGDSANIQADYKVKKNLKDSSIRISFTKRY